MGNLKKKKELLRRLETSQNRRDDTKDGDLKAKTAEISHARRRPLSVASTMFMREEEQRKTTEPGFSGYFRKKYADSPALAKLPTDEYGAKKFAVTNLKPLARPELAYPGSVAD